VGLQAPSFYKILCFCACSLLCLLPTSWWFVVSILKVEVICFSEMSVDFHRSTQLYIPEGRIFRSVLFCACTLQFFSDVDDMFVSWTNPIPPQVHCYGHPVAHIMVVHVQSQSSRCGICGG
jgi:hypothetical protein